MSENCGPVRVEARYVAAQGNPSGGNLYDVVDTAFGARAIIGDVHSSPPEAAALAAGIRVVFGELARHEPRLPGLAQRLDSFIATQVEEPGSSFVPASLVQVGAGGESAEVLVCGHTVPLVVRGRDTCPVPVLSVAPVLGLRRSAADWCSHTTFDFTPGDSLLMFTRGAVEATDGLGQVYPFERRAADLSGEDPKVVVDRLEAELVAHCGAAERSEITMMLLQAEEQGFLGYIPDDDERRSCHPSSCAGE
ncbi:PP2C family protein-serine/threonine phosphatase [Spongiactinospora sp. TRM90649]|uniref:PP2C family protein-serine/threonine phosphatase n=1 Tax=Spongiactinospora sp. TRM90649 TaxID=3031114 RepID=UPI0023F88658|nr:PP2C family protein-serine/threonine phosphatase [Spongiactinospora sp. TRM90649]MDF5759329.1 PP2C family protein-serine/threonine phosphatase [Spongiactinospora sp. TRM90649]